MFRPRQPCLPLRMVPPHSILPVHIYQTQHPSNHAEHPSCLPLWMSPSQSKYCAIASHLHQRSPLQWPLTSRLRSCLSW